MRLHHVFALACAGFAAGSSAAGKTVAVKTREGCAIVVPDEKYPVEGARNSRWIGDCVKGLAAGPGLLIGYNAEGVPVSLVDSWYVNGKAVGAARMKILIEGAGGESEVFSWNDESYFRNAAAVRGDEPQKGRQQPMAGYTPADPKKRHFVMATFAGATGTPAVQESRWNPAKNADDFTQSPCGKDCKALWEEKAGPLMRAFDAFAQRHAADVARARAAVEPQLARRAEEWRAKVEQARADILVERDTGLARAKQAEDAKIAAALGASRFPTHGRDKDTYNRCKADLPADEPLCRAAAEEIAYAFSDTGGGEFSAAFNGASGPCLEKEKDVRHPRLLYYCWVVAGLEARKTGRPVTQLESLAKQAIPAMLEIRSAVRRAKDSGPWFASDVDPNQFPANAGLNDFGRVTTTRRGKDPALQICIRDHQCEDGDILNVWLNGEFAIARELTNAAVCVAMPAHEGRNVVQIYAPNGTGNKGDCSYADANTGQITVSGVDASGNPLDSQTQSWNLKAKAGSRANLEVIVR